MRSKVAVSVLASCLGFVAAVHAQGFKTGAIGPLLKATPNTTCSSSAPTGWTNPTLFRHLNGDLGFLAHGTRPPGSTSCAYNEYIDSLWGARANGAGWTVPGTPSCPSLGGGYNRCGYTTANSGPLGNPSVVRIGNKFFMAFNGGNADFIVGKIYWAVSSDGVNWSVYNVNPPAGENWTPLLRPKYYDCGLKGFQETYLAFDPGDTSMGPSGTFYLWGSHWGLEASHPSGQYLDNWVIRFPYSASNSFGLGTGRQIWHLGQWKSFNSGTMVWNYDLDAGRAAVPGEPVLTAFQGEHPSGRFGFGAGDIQRDPLTGSWLHVWSFDSGTYIQSASSLASNLWSAPVAVDLQTARSLVPPSTPAPASTAHYETGLHYGASGNRTGWWIYVPVNYLGCSATYFGLGIVPAELCSQAAPVVSSLSVTSGPAAGGTQVTISGSRLDCASAVTFGGAAATLVSRTPNQLVVTTPPRAPGTVSVVVTTPGGSATRTNAYTYTAPPVYGGYHDGITCQAVDGWAWDANQPNTPISVDVYDGSTKLATVLANGFRQDLLNAGIGNGFHAFAYDLPASVRNGAVHSISVRFAGTTTLLNNSPKSIQCQAATARVIWLQPQALAGFGTPGSLVMAGSAAGAAAGSTVSVRWRNLTINGPLVQEPYMPLPSGGYWFHEILNANYGHRYEVFAVYGGVTSPACTYPGGGGMFWCP